MSDVMNKNQSVSELGAELRSKLMERGASLVGYADLSAVPEQERGGYRYGVAIAVQLPADVVRQLKDGPNMQYYNEYKRLNGLLNELDEYAAEILREKGYEAFPKTTENTVEDEETWTTVLPHKTVATRAGLGWIGKCALLVTTEFGSAVRISSVLTNAPLETGTPVDRSICGDCRRCADACLGKAATGELWSVDRHRDEFYDPHACRKAARERAAKEGIDATLCGMCIYVCPWTQRYINAAE